MRYYVSGSTASLRRLKDQYGEYLGFLLTPQSRHSTQSLVDLNLPWACDNGAYSGFDATAFKRMVERVKGQPRMLWVTSPDVVGDAKQTLELYRQWSKELSGVPLAYVLQDGQEYLELPPAECYFIGGSTEFKESEAARSLSEEAKRRGAILHMGRVNSLRRLWIAHGFGCDSVDGSSASRWGDKYIVQYPRWISQIERESELATLFE